jgi:hypothetical protein
MAIGFDARTVEALVVHGYPLSDTVGTRLRYEQCVALEAAIARLGSGLVAVPNGDLSETGSPNASTPTESVPFTFVIGALVARAGTAAQQDATTQSATVTDALAAKAEATFEAARPLIDDVLSAQGIAPTRPGLFVLAAGPLASAHLEGDAGSAIQRMYGDGDTEELTPSLTVSYDADPDAARVTIKGQFTLSARYD